MSKAKHRHKGRPYPWSWEIMYYKQLWWTVGKPTIQNVFRKLFKK